MAWSHGGGIDQFGCHNDRKHGGYHCHQGSFAGQTFQSKAEMVRLFKEMNSRQGNTARPNEKIPPTASAENETETCIREHVTGKVVCGETILR
jgi:hypothetical protein